VGVGAGVDFREGPDVDVGVDLGGLEPGVAEQFLDVSAEGRNAGGPRRTAAGSPEGASTGGAQHQMSAPPWCMWVAQLWRKRWVEPPWSMPQRLRSPATHLPRWAGVMRGGPGVARHPMEHDTARAKAKGPRKPPRPPSTNASRTAGPREQNIT